MYEGAEHISIASFPGMKERTVLLNGCSKSFAMTGFRVGYACAPGPIIEAMMKIHQYAIMCASNMSQEAAIEALENCQNEVETMRNDYERRRNFVVNRLNEIGLPCHLPQGRLLRVSEHHSDRIEEQRFLPPVAEIQESGGRSGECVR